MHRRAAPTHREHPVDDLRRAVLGAIAQRGQVWNQSYEPEEQRYGGVRGYCEDVPHERAAKLRPEPHWIRQRHQPVKQPRAAHVQERKHARAGHGEERHGFGEAVDRRAPLLAQQQQNGGDERPGVANSDPPDEIDNREAPADGYIDAPDAHTFNQQIANREVQKHQKGKGDRKAEKPALRRAASEHNRADLVGYRAKRMPRLDDRVSRG